MRQEVEPATKAERASRSLAWRTLGQMPRLVAPPLLATALIGRHIGAAPQIEFSIDATHPLLPPDFTLRHPDYSQQKRLSAMSRRFLGASYTGAVGNLTAWTVQNRLSQVET